MPGEEERDGETRRAMLDAWWAREPLGFEIREVDGEADRFEFTSRGDRVEGWLRRPGAHAAPLILAIPGSRAGCADPVVAGWATRWCEAGAAVACIDLPLHGGRESVKLTDALVAAAGDAVALAADPDRRRLVDEFLRQCRSDLAGALRGLGDRPGVDASRALCVGSGLGALACLHAGAGVALRGAVLIETPTAGDARHLGCPVLSVGWSGGTPPAAATECLAVDSPDAVAEASWPFVAGALGL